jgi:hypothetical protein
MRSRCSRRRGFLLFIKDAGAFDRGEFLAQQNIHVQATLRASTVLQKIAALPASVETPLARWRGNLRNELDALFPASPGVAGILRTMLLPGDAEKQAEAAMLAENDAAALHADVLKVGHHGSKNSTMPDFLAAVAPQISIISAGEENPYGTPQPGTSAAPDGDWDVAPAHRSRRRGARANRRAFFAGGLIRGLPENRGAITERASARSPPAELRKEENQPALHIRGFACIAPRKKSRRPHRAGISA